MMDYTNLINKLRHYDPRIVIENVDGCSEISGLVLPDFYQAFDPKIVEFEFNDGIVRLIPFAELNKTNREYDYIESDCVFATCNGDPIYLKRGQVYTCIHGSKRIIESKISDSVEEFFEMVNDTL